MTALGIVRTTSWDVELIRRDGSREALPVSGGSLDWDLSRASMAGGSLTVGEMPSGLAGAEVVVTQVVDGAPHAMGRYLVTAVSAQLGVGVAHTLELIDRTIIAERQRLLAPLSLPRGSHPVSVVRQRMDALGLDVTIDDDDKTLRAPMAWDVGTTELTVANDLLKAIGFDPIRPDGLELVSHPWLDAEAAASTWWADEGDEGWHVVNYGIDSDHLAIVNRVSGYTTASGDVPALRSVMEDWRTTEWSHDARGHWLDAAPIQSSAVTQAVLDAEVRAAFVARQATASMTLSHAWDERVRPNAVGWVESDAHPREVTGRWLVTGQSMPITGTPLVSSTLRRLP